MSYDIDIVDDEGNIIEFSDKHNIAGGTYMLGGTSAASLNITYNYAPHYYKHIDAKHGIRALYGMKASQVAAALLPVIQELGIERDEDYWKNTPGNAGHALFNLMTLCLMAPNGYLRGD